MTKEREALRLALAALETCVVYSPGTRFQIKNFDEVSITKSIKAIKEALAQPEQKPMTPGELVQRVEAGERWKVIGCVQHDCAECQARLAQPKQEPLEYWNAIEGWVKIDEVRQHFETVSCGTIYKTAGEDRVPLYTTPPKRQPLTLKQQQEIEIDMTINQGFAGMNIGYLIGLVIKATEAAHGIKELNHV